MNPLLLDASATARLLPWDELADAVADVLLDPAVAVPPRIVQPLAGGASLFVMPAADERTAITKLISFTPSNAGSGRATIQGDVVVFDVATGARSLILDGPTVTARRTAAVSLLAARRLAPVPRGRLLIVGAGVQGRAHLEAFAEGMGIGAVDIVSRSASSAEALARHARALGIEAQVATDAAAAMARCTLVVTCTPASAVALEGPARDDSFIAAVGAFTPAMRELGPGLCCDIARRGTIVVDTPNALHEAGDLLQAGIDVAALPTLRDVVGTRRRSTGGPVLFKSCGWAGWDLAAARCAQAQASQGA